MMSPSASTFGEVLCMLPHPVTCLLLTPPGVGYLNPTPETIALLTHVKIRKVVFCSPVLLLPILVHRHLSRRRWIWICRRGWYRSHWWGLHSNIWLWGESIPKRWQVLWSVRWWVGLIPGNNLVYPCWFFIRFTEKNGHNTVCLPTLTMTDRCWRFGGKIPQSIFFLWEWRTAPLRAVRTPCEPWGLL